MHFNIYTKKKTIKANNKMSNNIAVDPATPVIFRASPQQHV